MAATEIPELSGAELVCLHIRALALEKLVIKEKVVRYDSVMTTPPDGLPHRIASLVLTEFLQTQKKPVQVLRTMHGRHSYENFI